MPKISKFIIFIKFCILILVSNQSFSFVINDRTYEKGAITLFDTSNQDLMKRVRNLQQLLSSSIQSVFDTKEKTLDLNPELSDEQRSAFLRKMMEQSLFEANMDLATRGTVDIDLFANNTLAESVYRGLTGLESRGVGKIFSASSFSEGTSASRATGTGVLILPNVVLTAAHVLKHLGGEMSFSILTDPFQLKYETRFINKIVIKKGEDLALVLLDKPINEVPCAVISDIDPSQIPPEARRGVGVSQQKIYSNGIGQSSSFIRHLMITNFTVSGQEIRNPVRYELDAQGIPRFRLDDPSKYHRLQGALVHGDSGSPLLIKINGGFEVIGIAVHSLFKKDEQATDHSEIDVWYSLFGARAWISKVIIENFKVDQSTLISFQPKLK